MLNSDLTKSIPTHIKSKELVEKRREQIVLAAIKLFSKKGFVKTTLKDLAEEAGLSYGNLYDYVGNKEDIFLLVHDFITGLADQGLEKCIENINDPLEKLRRMIHSEFDLSYRWSDAILFVYQDIHVLKKPLLKKLLNTESNHVRKFRSVIEECIEKGLLQPCNTQVVANLVKIMVDSWVIKRWDLKGISQFQMENSILNLVFDGLNKDKSVKDTPKSGNGKFEGKSILMVNGDSVFGSAISSFLFSEGARLAIYLLRDNMAQDFIDLTSLGRDESKRITLYSSREYGPLTPLLFRQIQNECGPLDIFIQDIGIADSETISLDGKKDSLNKRLVENLHMVRDISGIVEREFSNRRGGKVLYIAPWAWDKYVDPVLYETVKASLAALTKVTSERMREFGVNVNCLLPGHIGGIKNLSVQNEEVSKLIERIANKGNLGEVSDIVGVTSFLISDTAKYITGQTIAADGGIV